MLLELELETVDRKLVYKFIGHRQS